MPLSPPPSFPVSSGKSDIYLHLLAKRAGKIRGEASAGGHENDIEVRSWNWGLSASSAIGSTAATARRSYKALTIVKAIDSATTGLMAALATNDELKEVRLGMRKAGGQQLDYFSVTLKQARVIAIDHKADAGSDASEVVSIAFTQVDVEYRPQRQAGGLSAAYSFSDQILPA